MQQHSQPGSSNHAGIVWMLAVLLVLLPLLGHAQTLLPPLDGPDVGETMPCHSDQAESSPTCADCDDPNPGCDCCDQAAPASLVGVPAEALGADYSRGIPLIETIPALSQPPLFARYRPPRTRLI